MIGTKPASMMVAVGQTATFSVSASGAPFNVQWYRNGVAISGATSTSYTTPVLASYDDGTRYAVAVSNESGTTVSPPVLLSLGNTVWSPVVSEQPIGASLAVGQSATFRVAAYGTGALSYQWLVNGNLIAGATADSYTTPVQASTTNGPGTIYQVRITNAGGSVLSEQVRLIVTAAAAPTLASGPFSVSTALGALAVFTTTPGGTAPFTYQWRRNGIAIPGATSPAHITAPTTAADSGANFSVVVTNGVGTATSVDVPLTVVTQWSGIREDGSTSTGATGRDDAQAVTTDAEGNVVIAGQVSGSFGNDNPGLVSEAYVAKYNRTGATAWAHRSLAGPTLLGIDVNRGVATDSAGNIYTVGSTFKVLPGQTEAGGSQDTDVAIVKYASDGSLLWMRQLGSTANDAGFGVAVDASGNVFVAGEALVALPGQPPSSGYIFIAKYDANGDRLWIRQTGGRSSTSGAPEGARGIAIDAAGNAYIGGYINAAFAGGPDNNSDTFAAKYDTNGNQLWFSRVLAGAFQGGFVGQDKANAIAVSADGSAVYLAGQTLSDFDAAGFPPIQTSGAIQNREDAFVLRLNGSTGTLQWARNLSSVPQTNQTYFTDEAFGVTTNATGSAVFVTGATAGQMPGDTSKGDLDIFVARYEGDGTRTWVRQFGADAPSAGAARNDAGRAITIDRDGNLFVVGEVIGTFGTPGRFPNRTDWFVMKLRPVDGTAF